MNLPRLIITRRYVSRHCRGLTEESSTLNEGDTIPWYRIPKWIKRRKQLVAPAFVALCFLTAVTIRPHLPRPELKPFPAQWLFCTMDHIRGHRIFKLWLCCCLCQVLCENKEKNNKDGARTCRRSVKPDHGEESLWNQGMRRRWSLELWTRETWERSKLNGPFWRELGRPECRQIQTVEAQLMRFQRGAELRPFVLSSDKDSDYILNMWGGKFYSGWILR